MYQPISSSKQSYETVVLLASVYNWRNYGTERLSNLSMVMQREVAEPDLITDSLVLEFDLTIMLYCLLALRLFVI